MKSLQLTMSLAYRHSENWFLCLQRDLPLGILVSLAVCAGMYVAVCLVVTGMVPYMKLGGDAPLANAFKEKGLNFVSTLIAVGAVCGLTTTLLVGLFVQVHLRQAYLFAFG